MKRAKHSLSQYRLTSLNQGTLFPVLCEEVLPGDSFRHQTSALIRVSPLVAPVMHPVHVSVHHWFVPNRILWDNWETFITGKDPALVVPTVSIAAADTAALQMAQSFGVGADAPPSPIVLNSLPFRAYNTILNEFYRDQDLTTALVERRGDTGDLAADYALRKASWEKDYFTTARPTPQQGASTETVALQLSGLAPVKGFGILNSPAPTFTGAATMRETGGGTKSYTKTLGTGQGSISTANWTAIEEDPTKAGYPNIKADLSGVTVNAGFDINEWRRSFAMQRMREHRNRYGSRYTDYLAFLGITSSDARLQRPEYLGGGKQTISFSEVLATAETAGGPVVGDMAGHGIAALRTRPYKRFFEEHGYVITFMLVRPQSLYLTRVPRHFLRRDYEQYWQKELEMMGDQVLTNFEIYGDTATPSGTFGYSPRYDEYRHAESSISGEFRNVLDYWHMAREFTSQPVLNGTFVSCNPTDRIYASAITDELYVMCSHRISARRLVSKFARN